MKTEFIPGKIDRKAHIRNCVAYFKAKYAESYFQYVEANAKKRATRANQFGVIDKKADVDMAVEGFREGVTLPEKLFNMINGSMPDTSNEMKQTLIIDPPFLQSGKEHAEFARKELQWFRTEFPEFATSERY